MAAIHYSKELKLRYRFQKNKQKPKKHFENVGHVWYDETIA